MPTRTLSRLVRAPAAALSLALATACGASAPPRELVDARAAYKRASESGDATKFVPTALHEAKTALDQAERAFQDDADSPNTKDLSYVAQRKAELAEARAGISSSDKVRDQARADLQQKLSQIESANQGELSKTRDQLAREQAAREQAERAARDSTENAARIAAEKERQRKNDVTVTGSVLFGAGESMLTPIAQERLNQAAQTLKENEHIRITVEGHTDNSAKEKKGDLSRRRAEVVRDYLVSKGVASERINVMAMGSARPAADNKTVEGRANNRRVELITQR
ncbi:MAG TPA: OmpA family protein [Polyangiaceae bacterium]|nr:OmpA family protein [Polyangiaceae bacterium]